MRSRGERIALAGAGLALALVATAGIAAARGAPDDTGSTYGYLKLFNEVLALVKNSYVEDVPETDLMKGAYAGLLSSLDGESEYVTASEHQQARASKGASEADAGLFLTKRDGIVFVAAVLPGTDAQAKGLRLGDQIRRIGDRSGRDMTLSESVRALRGPNGSRIAISISRREEPRREDVEVARKKLTLPPPKIEPSQDGVGIVRIPDFGAGSAKALAGLLDRLQKEKTRRAVLDLRGNAWGDLDEALRAAALFTGDVVLARLRDRGGQETPLRGTGPKTSWSGDLLLLTDAGTAYAAEAFVAALVDQGLAKQGGETTLGRGGEQELLPLANGDFISLTVRKLVSPSGKAWHGTGLTPSVPLPADPAAPAKERADRQLRKAIDWLRDSAASAKAA